LRNIKGYSCEKRLIGRVAVGGCGVLIGRIRFFDESYTEGSILCVRAGERIERATLLLCPPSAVIAFCGDNDSYAGELCSLGVPCVLVDSDGAEYESYRNKVALIDTERCIFALDPSVETLELYRSPRSEGSRLSCPVGRIIERSGELAFSEERGSFFISSELLCAEGELFDSAVSLWERLIPELIVVDMATPSGETSLRAFSENAEQLFCAALYGSFAVSFSGFHTESELADAISVFHKAFCVLEAEGREFNGYIPRGITVSSPLWLMRSCPVTNPDFIILDTDLLIPSLFSLEANEVIKKEKALKKELFPLIERYFTHFAPKCDVYIKSKSFYGSAFLRELVSIVGARAVFR
jgi:hypothetical protein